MLYSSSAVARYGDHQWCICSRRHWKEAARVLLSPPRSHGVAGGFLPDSMGPSRCICLSSVHSDQKGDQSSIDLPRSQNDPGCPMSTTGGMVSWSAGTSSGFTESHLSLANPPTTISLQMVPSAREGPEPSRLEIIQRIHGMKGFLARLPERCPAS